MPPKNQQLPQLKQQRPHTSYTQVLLHELSGSAHSVMIEWQRDIVTNAASEHVTNVSTGVVNAGGGSVQDAMKNTGAKIGSVYNVCDSIVEHIRSINTLCSTNLAIFRRNRRLRRRRRHRRRRRRHHHHRPHHHQHYT